jgi:hypothetical protein
MEDVEIGPIDYLVVEYPSGGPTGEALPHLIDAVDRGLIRVLDVALIAKGDDGRFASVDVTDVVSLGADELAVLEGASSGILDDEDLAAAAEALAPGTIGAILVYENSWAAPFATALRRAGGQMVATGRIPVQDILDALDDSGQE